MTEQAAGCGLCGGPIAVGAETTTDPRTPVGVCHASCVERWENRHPQCHCAEGDDDTLYLDDGRVWTPEEVRDACPVHGEPAKEPETCRPADESGLPTIEEVSGLVDDFTGGLSLKEYMGSIRGQQFAPTLDSAELSRQGIEKHQAKLREGGMEPCQTCGWINPYSRGQTQPAPEHGAASERLSTAYLMELEQERNHLAELLRRALPEVSDTALSCPDADLVQLVADIQAALEGLVEVQRGC